MMHRAEGGILLLLQQRRWQQVQCNNKEKSCGGSTLEGSEGIVVSQPIILVQSYHWGMSTVLLLEHTEFGIDKDDDNDNVIIWQRIVNGIW